MKRVMALLMAVFVLSGFSWGRSEEEQQQPVKKKTQTPYASSQTYGETSSKKKSYSAAESRPMKSQAQPAAQAGTVDGQFPTQLLSSLASGDEDVRRARIESLRRLSEAMSKMNARQQPAAE